MKGKINFIKISFYAMNQKYFVNIVSIVMIIIIAATFSNCSGFAPKIWAIIGCSASVCHKSTSRRSLLAN